MFTSFTLYLSCPKGSFLFYILQTNCYKSLFFLIFNEHRMRQVNGSMARHMLKKGVKAKRIYLLKDFLLSLWSSEYQNNPFNLWSKSEVRTIFRYVDTNFLRQIRKVKNATEGGQIHGPPPLKTYSPSISLASPPPTPCGEVISPSRSPGHPVPGCPCANSPCCPKTALDLSILGWGKWVKNGVGEVKRETSMWWRGYHISGTNPLRVLQVILSWILSILCGILHLVLCVFTS